MKNQSGFTLIELIMVIVILGILAATALPRFTNMKTEAEEAALKGVQGGINSANAINRATSLLNSASSVAVDNCDDAARLMDGGALPQGFSVAASAIAPNQTASCTLTGPYAGGTSTVPVTITGAAGV